MGFSSSWIAVKDLAPATVMAELGLEVVSEHNEHPEGDFSLAQLANGWTVVWFDSGPEAAFKAPHVKLAFHGPAVAAGIEEHVMFAEARGYVDGKEAWRVTRDLDADDEDLETSGDVPTAYAAIRDAAIARQEEDGNEDVDLLFDVPLDLAESVCGYRHDVVLTDGTTFLELRRAEPAGGSGKSGFFARLFGRG